jgi:ethanolamine utilization protein EutQ (cupin superfamily)
MIKYGTKPPSDEETVQKLREEHARTIGRKEKQYEDFASLLDTISSVEEKTKSLWRQIYENAVEDRQNAGLMWTDLYIRVHGKAEEHAIHGATLAKYIERMSKANEQLVKLTDLVSKASNIQVEETISDEDIYREVEKHHVAPKG